MGVGVRQSMDYLFALLALSLNLLHSWPSLSKTSTHSSSNLSESHQCVGHFSKMIPFNSISSLIGSAGCPRPPLTVHRTRTSGPKSASSANLTVNKLALSSLCRSLYFSRMVCTVSSFILSMALDGRGALCLHVRIGFGTQSGGGFGVFVE